jgi:hypothetical protein
VELLQIVMNPSAASGLADGTLVLTALEKP